jgi:hypothetical protein
VTHRPNGTLERAVDDLVSGLDPHPRILDVSGPRSYVDGLEDLARDPYRRGNDRA